MNFVQIPTLLQCLDQLQHSIPRSAAVAAVLLALVIGFLLGVWWRDRHGPKADAEPSGKVPAPRAWPVPPKPSIWAGDFWTSCHKHRRAYRIGEACSECEREAKP